MPAKSESAALFCHHGHCTGLRGDDAFGRHAGVRRKKLTASSERSVLAWQSERAFAFIFFVRCQRFCRTPQTAGREIPWRNSRAY